ncbi:MAG: hypothetical protein EA399_10960 [Desulfovibrionales bacterium]|nr:MAG: hypothetical protein EA399_10960 [Desulfovibrionales bacterium]
MEVVFRGPAAHLNDAATAMAALGFERMDLSRPWREYFPEISDQTLQSVCLRAARTRVGITQAKLHGSFSCMDDLRPGLEALDERGYIRPLLSAPGPGRPSLRYETRPELLGVKT